tara:strand:- start:789 stop:1106 length:318 start_codon:yes stop_codon:yes gene_type:complete
MENIQNIPQNIPQNIYNKKPIVYYIKWFLILVFIIATIGSTIYGIYQYKKIQDLFEKERKALDDFQKKVDDWKPDPNCTQIKSQPSCITPYCTWDSGSGKCKDKS